MRLAAFALLLGACGPAPGEPPARPDAAAGAPEAGDATAAPEGTVTILGTLTGEGIECQAMRGEDGRLYTLVGEIGDAPAGARVRVEGEVQAMSICQQGTTVAVERMERLPD